MIRRPSPRPFAPSFLALGLAVLAAGCGSKPGALAVVGTRTVTRAEFEDVARRAGSQYGPVVETAKRTLFEDLVRRDLLLAAADKAGLFRDPQVLRARERAQEQVLSRTLVERLTPQKVAVSDAEIARLYSWLGTQAHLQMVYAVDRSSADAAMTELRQGRDFGEVSTRFTPPNLLPPGGDIGWLTSGSLVPPLDDFLRDAPVGVLQGPVEAPGEGWFIVRVLGRRTVPARAPIEAMGPSLGEMLRQRKVRLESTRAFQDLRRAYHATVTPEGPQVVYQASAREDSSDPALRREPNAEERATVLATFDDERGRPQRYTLGDALADLNQPDIQHPNAKMVPAIREWIESRVMSRVILAESRRRRLHEEPEVKRQVDEQVNNLVLDEIYNRLVQFAAQPSDEQLRAAYERHADAFQRLDFAHFTSVTLPDSAAAAALVEHAAHAGTLREAAGMAGIADRVKDESVRYPTSDAAWKPLTGMFLSMRAGNWSGPFQSAGVWRVVQLLDKKQSVMPLEALPPTVHQNLEQEALMTVRDARLMQVTDSLRQAIKPYELHPERLARIAWPTPAGGVN